MRLGHVLHEVVAEDRREGIVEETEAAAKDRFVAAARRPGKAEAGRPVDRIRTPEQRALVGR